MDDLNNDFFHFISESIMKSAECFAKAFQSIHSWLNNNSKGLYSAISALGEIFGDIGVLLSAAEVLAKNQIVFTDDLHLDFAKALCDDATNVDDLVKQYYFQNDSEHMNELIDRCLHAEQIVNYRLFYDQVIESYNRKHYQIACVGLFSLVDGVLSDVESTMNNTSFEKRLNSIEKKVMEKSELDEFDIRLICIVESIDKFNSSIFAFSDFSQKEPDILNRNWLLHGRTRREYSQYDFLKILLWLDALIFLDKINTEHEELNSTNITATSC